MLVILDRQHGYKEGTKWLSGACADIDGDGVKEDWEQEARLTYRYIQYAAGYLYERGHSVLIIDSGRYINRHGKANMRAKHYDGKAAYVACHLNAGGGDYSLVLHDARSAGGEALARCLRSKLKVLFPEYRDRKVRACGPDSWANAYATITGIYSGPRNISAVCYEPLFMDNVDHQQILNDEDGIRMLGEALAKGCLAWGGEDV